MPIGIPDDHVEHSKMMMELMAREVSYRSFPQIGVPDPFHATSHHQDGDITPLDHSLILYGSSMTNSNMHNHAPLPVFVAGGANVNAHNKRGFTALDLAMGKGGYNGALGPVHDAIATMIRQVGGEPGQEVKETAKAAE